MQKSSFEQNGGTYRKVGDYCIPNLTLPPEEANIKLGKWGQMHRDYLRKHKPVVFVTLLAQHLSTTIFIPSIIFQFFVV